MHAKAVQRVHAFSQTKMEIARRRSGPSVALQPSTALPSAALQLQQAAASEEAQDAMAIMSVRPSGPTPEELQMIETMPPKALRKRETG